MQNCTIKSTRALSAGAATRTILAEMRCSGISLDAPTLM